MSYSPTTWSAGDVITAAKMNKIEQGIVTAESSGGSSSGGTGALIATCAYNSSLNSLALDKTVTEISDAITSGTPVYMKFRYGTSSSFVDDQYLAPIIHVYRYGTSSPEYRIMAAAAYNWGNLGNTKSFCFTPSMIIFRATAANAYPVWYAQVYPASGAFVAS